MRYYEIVCKVSDKTYAKLAELAESTPGKTVESIATEGIRLHAARRLTKRDRVSEEFPCPTGFETSQFREAWSEYYEYRRKMKWPCSSVVLRRLHEACHKLGESKATLSLVQSLMHGWRDLYEPGPDNAVVRQKKTASDYLRGI